MKDRHTVYLLGVLAGVVSTVALIAFVQPIADLLPGTAEESRTDQAREIIEDSYFRETDSTKLEDASIDGMVRKISKENDDKFSNYFDAEAYARFQVINSGQFSGIGTTVTERKKGLEVVMVYPESPAEKAGITTGDVIVAVEGESIAGVDSEQAANRIKGPPGTEVEITVADGKTGKKRTIDVERAQVRIPAVTSRMERTDDGEKVGYVQLATFSNGAHGEVRKAIEDLQKKGAEGIVFDLRSNGGGLLDEAVLVTSIFQQDGPIVTIEGRNRDKQTFDATGDALDVGPLVVLVNGDTASASEITSAALQENDLADIVGERTYGKGVFQEVIQLEGGGALDITVGEYLTADGTSILGKGVVPDEKVVDKDLEDDEDAVLDAGLSQIGSELDDGKG